MSDKAPQKRHFEEALFRALSAETSKSLTAFAEHISLAEALLRDYHRTAAPAPEVSYLNVLLTVRDNARLVFTMSWTKAVFFSRAIVDSTNDGNFLVSFQSLRSYVELVAALRYTKKKMTPVYEKMISEGQFTTDEAVQLAKHMHLLLHGGRFNWKTYFSEGAAAIMDRKLQRKTRDEKKKYATNHLRIGDCINDWAKETPAAEFIYDYLCDLVHPNKGSNLVLPIAGENGFKFTVEGDNAMGLLIFDRIFGYAANMCVDTMGRCGLFFETLACIPDEELELVTVKTRK